MQAKDIMTTSVLTVGTDTSVKDVAAMLLQRRVSGAPVVDADNGVVGIVSEGDLIRRAGMKAERHPSWWLSLLSAPEDRALAYVKSHGGTAGEVMTRAVIAVEESTSLEEIASTLSKHDIKRVPVLHDGKLAGIVSRADLLRGLTARLAAPTTSADDETIKNAIVVELARAVQQPEMLSVVVSGGVVHIWGAVDTDSEAQAAKLASRNVPGVKEVRDEIKVWPANVRAAMWAE